MIYLHDRNLRLEIADKHWDDEDLNKLLEDEIYPVIKTLDEGEEKFESLTKFKLISEILLYKKPVCKNGIILKAFIVIFEIASSKNFYNKTNRIIFIDYCKLLYLLENVNPYENFTKIFYQYMY